MGNGNGSGLSLDHLFRWQEKFYSTRLITLARVILHSFLIRWRQVSPQHHNASSLIITFKSSYQTLIPYISVYFFLTYTSYIICNCIHKRWWVCIVYKSTHITAEATDHSKRLPPPQWTHQTHLHVFNSIGLVHNQLWRCLCMYVFILNVNITSWVDLTGCELERYVAVLASPTPTHTTWRSHELHCFKKTKSTAGVLTFWIDYITLQWFHFKKKN